jgi:hypothetical protein
MADICALGDIALQGEIERERIKVARGPKAKAPPTFDLLWKHVDRASHSEV